MCDAMDWVRLDTLPTGMVAYCRAGLDAYAAGARLAVHFQLPNDTIAYDPNSDRLHIVPVSDYPARASRPDSSIVAFAERAVGHITEWTDVSWAREASCVWRARAAGGGTWYVKIHQNAKFHSREVRAYRTWAPTLGAATPRLVAADAQLRTVVVTAVPGRPLYGAVLSAEEERQVFHRIGALARLVHQSTPPRPAPVGSGPAVDKAERHLAAAGPHLACGDAEFVRALVKRAGQLPPLEWVETHGDFQLRNILGADGGTLWLIDFERSEPGPAIRDLVRLSDAWAGRPDLYEAFLAGYGRTLTGPEEARLAVEAALDAMSGIQFGIAHGDPELVERGRRTLARLRGQGLISTRGGPS